MPRVNINLGCNYFNSFDQIRNSWALHRRQLQAGRLDHAARRLRYNTTTVSRERTQPASRQRSSADRQPRFFSLQPDGSFAPTLALLDRQLQHAGQSKAQPDLAQYGTHRTRGVDFNVTATRSSTELQRGYRSAAFNSQFLFTRAT